MRTESDMKIFDTVALNEDLVETDLTDGDTIFRKRIKVLAELSRPLAERKVDLVVKSRGSQQNLPIYQVARESGVRL